MFILFVVKNDSSEIDIQDILSGKLSNETLKELYANEIYKKALMTWLPFLNERGFLDRFIIDEPDKVAE